MASSDWIPVRQAAAAVFIILLFGSIGAHLNGAPSWFVLTLVAGAIVALPLALLGQK